MRFYRWMRQNSRQQTGPGTQRSGFAFDTTMLMDQLNTVRDQLHSDIQFQVMTVGAATVFTTVLSAGYIFWTIRGGYLLATVLSSMPAWRMMDPLPILGMLDPLRERQKRKEEEAKDESLQSLVEKNAASRSNRDIAQVKS
jgi:hypothetical protein